MSGGASNKKRASGKTQGWEEAGAEFYSESYPTGDIELDVFQRDPSHITTLLPSKQSRFATAKHGTRTTDTRTMRRRTYTRSRQSTVRRASTVNQEVHVSMMPDLSENLSNEERTWEEIMQIKAMPIPMYQKKEMKAKLQNATYLRLQGYEQFKWKQRKVYQQLHVKWNEFLNKIQLWKNSLKKIEGNFGTGIVAYFLFIKWLMFLNLLSFFLIFLFIILPTVLFNKSQTVNITVNVCENLTTIQCCSELYYNKTLIRAPTFYDIIQGTGWFEYTIMFYGFYTNKIYDEFTTKIATIINTGGNTGNGTNDEFITFDEETSNFQFFYNLPLAYILIMIAYFFISLIAIVRSAAHGFKDRLIESEGQYYHYSNIIFGGWDFCIQNEKSAQIKHKALYNELKSSLLDEKLEEERQNRTKEEKFKLFLIRFLINTCILIILIMCGVFIYFIVQFSWINILHPTQSLFDNFDNLCLQLLPSFSIVILNLIVPIIFKFLIQFENYSPRLVVPLSLIRIVLLRLSSLGILLTTIYYLVDCNNKSFNNNIYKAYNDSALFVNVSFDDCIDKDCNTPLCWETYAGQQIYKLLIIDFLIQLFMTFFINFVRSFVAKHIKNKCIQLFGAQQFELTKHVLDIVYMQTLCWLGTFFSPILPALCTVCLFFMFYIKKFACLVNSTPPLNIYRASKSNSIFMYVLILSFTLAIAPICFSIGQLSPSKSCGPFRDYNTVWSLVYNTFLKLPNWLRSIIFFFSTASFVLPLLACLILMLYYYYALNAANKHMVCVLKNQLILEGHDKQFLLNRLSAFIKQQQEYQKKFRNSERERDSNRGVNISSN